MSIKTTFFNVKMKAGPAVSHTYVINIRGFNHIACLISSAPVPTPARGSVAVNYLGETYNLPTSVELSSGDWTVTLYENALMEVMHAFYYAFTNNQLDPMFEVDIYSVQGDYSFKVHTRLKNCWIKSFATRNLDGSASGEIVTSSVTLVYNGVELVETSLDNPVANLIKYSALHLASKASSTAAGAIDFGASFMGFDTSLATKAKEVDLTTSEIVAGAKLLDFVLGGGVL